MRARRLPEEVVPVVKPDERVGGGQGRCVRGGEASRIPISEKAQR